MTCQIGFPNDLILLNKDAGLDAKLKLTSRMPVGCHTTIRMSVSTIFLSIMSLFRCLMRLYDKTAIVIENTVTTTRKLTEERFLICNS